jgi:hypothetical protein
MAGLFDPGVSKGKGCGTKLDAVRKGNRMTIGSRHFSISRLFQRLWALGLKPDNFRTESASPDPATRLKMSVFIDVENVNNEVAIRSVFESLAPHWNCICRRAYGSGLATHLQLFRDLGISPIEVFHNTPGKNAADIALVIDAMKELSLGRSEAFCIVSGDGDFSRLVLTIREWGLPVLVFGPENTPESLRSAGTEFRLLSMKQAQKSGSSAPKAAASPSRAPGKRTVTRKDQAELINLVSELAASTGKTSVRAINEAGCRRDVGFCSKQYGDQKLSLVLRGSGLFHLEPIANSNGTVDDYEVRPITTSALPAEGFDRQNLSGTCLVTGTSTVKLT